MKKFRVEAFIVPTKVSSEQSSTNNQSNVESNSDKLPDESNNCENKIEIESVNTNAADSSEGKADILDQTTDSCCKSDEEEQYSSEFSGLFFEIDEHIYDEIIIPNKNIPKLQVRSEKTTDTQYSKAFLKIEEPIYDEPFVGNLTKINPDNAKNIYDVPQNSWMLGNSKYRRFGIVAPKIPKRSSSLKSITEDIENFDATLEALCHHDRECGCQVKHENPEDISEEIFKENWMKKLDALRKLETLLRDKEIALQSRERLLFKKEKELRILERLVKDKMRQTELYAKRYKKSLSSDSIPSNDRILESRSSGGSKGQAKSDLSNAQSKVTLRSSTTTVDEIKNHANFKNSVAANSLNNRASSVRSRSRPRNKIRYEDFDSTLSADTGDSSCIASKKLDVQTFSRSASERKPTIDQKITAARLASLIENDEHVDTCVNLIEEKTIKRISQNILAFQDQSTKFLNYGLIDEESAVKSLDRKVNQNRISYLNLESVNGTVKSKPIPKERPVTWNAETDDWLMKKRLAYNLATKTTSQENGIEKENLDKQSKLNKSAKVIKKKENNRKKFSIFR